MATLCVTMVLLMLAAATTLVEARLATTNFIQSGSSDDDIEFLFETLSVFKEGNLKTTTINVKTSDSSSPPRPLLIVSPTKTGNYPVLLFAPGALLANYFYSDLFHHIASHGYIVVSPQLYNINWFPPAQTEEIEKAVLVANWLPTNLESVVPEGVIPDLTNKLAVSGHSRGGKTAFALALGQYNTPLNVKISALIGVDPVAGSSKADRTEPRVLTYVPNSFDLSIPVTVIGTGLGNQSRLIIGPACAPNEVGHVEFFNECKDGTQFVIADYGHMDMLNDNVVFDFPMGFIARQMCVNGNGKGSVMRSTLGGIVVAFLDAYFLDETQDFQTILAQPSVAPTLLFPVQEKGNVFDKHAQLLSSGSI